MLPSLSHALLPHDEPANDRILRPFYLGAKARESAADVVSLEDVRKASARANAPR